MGVESHNAMLTLFECTRMILPFEPRGSSFIPNSNTMYYYINTLDKIVDERYAQDPPSLYWHPYCSRIYFGQLFCIQVARCMEEAGALSTGDSLFLEHFLKKYPLDTLTIPGPLMPLFQSICCSSTQPHNLRVYPTLPKSSYLHRRTPEGAPLPVPSSWLIPNIPELIGLANRLCSPEARRSLAAGNLKNGYRYNPLEKIRLSRTLREDEVVMNGYNWTRQWYIGHSTEVNVGSDQDSSTESDDSEKKSVHEDEEDRLKSKPDLGKATLGGEPPSSWYFATPGLAYHLEYRKDSEKRFIENDHKLQFPIFTKGSSFDTLEKFLGLEEAGWFGALSQMMSDYSRLFKKSGNLGQCAVNGPRASQVVIRYTRPEKQLEMPRFPGDSRYNPCFYFKAHSKNLELSDEEARLGFYSQLNTLYWPEHPFMSSIHNYEGSYMTGPFWQSSTLERRSNHSLHYLVIPRIFSYSVSSEQGRNQSSAVILCDQSGRSRGMNAESNSNVNLEGHHEFLAPYSVDSIRLAPPPYPAKSTFIPSSNTMYYYIHILDDLISCRCASHRPEWNWHPYISRIYFGILFCIQVARCMREAGVLSPDDSAFLRQFLEKYPLDTLTIAGPLMPLFQSICCSKVEPNNFKILPALPKSSYLHRRTPEGAPLPVPSSWLIPNIPELIGLANRLCSPEAKRSLAGENFGSLYSYNPLEIFHFSGAPSEGEVIINGCNWTRQSYVRHSTGVSVRSNQDSSTKADDLEEQVGHEDEEDILNSKSNIGKATLGGEPPSSWYFATPGLAHPLECDEETTKHFINHGDRLKLPQFTVNSKFDTLERFLGLVETSWFRRITVIMSDYSRFCKEGGNLSQCPVDGPEASQIIIRYTRPRIPLKTPRFPGDMRYSPYFGFRAHTINLGLTDEVERMGFFSQLNTLYSPDHPFMGLIHDYTESYMTGPFWQSSAIEKTSNYSTSYCPIHTIFSKLVRCLEDD